MAFAIWIGLGINFALEKLPLNSPIFKSVLMAVPILLIAFRAILMIPEQNLSTDHRAEQYAQTVLASLPDRAIVFTKGDEALFSLWYFHYGDHWRPDVAVVSEELLTQPWYRDVLKYTYLDLNVPATAQTQAFVELNPQRPVCLLDAGLEPHFACNP
jgi:hypothetical protein